MAFQSARRQLVCFGLASAASYPRGGLRSTLLRSPNAAVVHDALQRQQDGTSSVRICKARLIIVACASFSNHDRWFMSFRSIVASLGIRPCVRDALSLSLFLVLSELLIRTREASRGWVVYVGRHSSAVDQFSPVMG